MYEGWLTGSVQFWWEMMLIVPFQGDIDGKGLKPSALDNVLCVFLGFIFLGICIYGSVLCVIY